MSDSSSDSDSEQQYVIEVTRKTRALSSARSYHDRLSVVARDGSQHNSHDSRAAPESIHTTQGLAPMEPVPLFLSSSQSTNSRVSPQASSHMSSQLSRSFRDESPVQVVPRDSVSRDSGDRVSNLPTTDLTSTPPYQISQAGAKRRTSHKEMRESLQRHHDAPSIRINGEPSQSRTDCHLAHSGSAGGSGAKSSNRSEKGNSSHSLSAPLSSKSRGDKIKTSVMDLLQDLKLKKEDDKIEDEEEDKERQLQDHKQNPFEKYLITKINELIEIYYEKVSYRQESWMYMFLLIPFIAVAASLPYCSGNQFPDHASALAVKVIIVLLGIVAVHMCELVNQRHADLSTISKIINGEATVKTICEHVQGKSHNKNLNYLAFLFYGMLMITEFSINNVFVNSIYGTGSAWTLDASNLTSLADTNSSAFQLSVGAQFGCDGCVGYVSEGVLFVPISEILFEVPSAESSIEIISNSDQDIISIEAECFSITTNASRMDNQIQIVVDNFEVGTRTTLLDIEIVSSANFTSTVMAKRCSLVFRDLSGTPNVRYGVSDTGRVSRTSVDLVTTRQKPGCYHVAALCLHSSDIPDISTTFLREALSSFLLTSSQNYAYSIGLFPDPSIDIMDSVYGERVAEAFGMMMLMTVSKYNYKQSTVTVLSDSVAVRLYFNTPLMILTIITAIICPIIALVLLMVDIIKLGKANDYLLRRLSQNIRAGKKHIEELSEYTRSIFQPGEDSWTSAPVRFGEDRATTSDALGKLRFGGKKDVGRITGHTRGKRNSKEHTTLIDVEGARTTKDAEFYLGKRVAYVYRAKRIIDGSKVRVIWGRITRSHGTSGVVRAKFASNIPPKAFGAIVRIVSLRCADDRCSTLREFKHITLENINLEL
ncbi:hypothetical protein HDU91_000705 [Kappamyces sp. JEL0680]|nr:hypothetical protein HDU91_000705 [Kappamyces sp. JEL0680]